MGDLVKQTPYSEVTATLELFGSLGVTRAHLTRLRSDREAAERVVGMILEIGVRSVARFDPGVLDTVRGFGGQFADAKIIAVPGGESLDSQRRTIKFWNSWSREMGRGENLTVAPSIGSEVIYLPDVVGGSLRCTFDKVEGRDCVRDILGRLPNVPGVRWIVGNTPTYCLILADHLRNEVRYLLSSVYAWTTDIYKSPEYGPCRLVVGLFGSDGVGVSYLLGCRSGDVGLFVLGVPQDS